MLKIRADRLMVHQALIYVRVCACFHACSLGNHIQRLERELVLLARFLQASNAMPSGQMQGNLEIVPNFCYLLLLRPG